VVSDEDVTITIDLADAFADVDGDSLSLSFDALPSWLVYDAQAGTLSGTPGNAQVGSYTITATASDGGNDGTASQTFSVVVQNVNDAP
ncbi:putative Ig domain-containing protein, partial [Enterococcus casseliflavus]|uniref:putative Ig domain-containing protein n=1 Tax=Enterococcus casseliflavus TaxID=37734 RepID=UPI003D0F968B